MTALRTDRQMNEDQTLFMLRFADVLDKVYDEEQRKPPENRGVYHILLLGQGGSGKTHIVQNLIFPIVHFIWPAEGEEDSMMVVAAKNAQAKNISTDQVAAKTLHAASCMRVQSLSIGNMTAGTAEKRLKTLWNSIRVLIIEEISMVSAMMYNMLDFGAMLGRRVAWHVDPHTYSKVGCAFGRVPTFSFGLPHSCLCWVTWMQRMPMASSSTRQWRLKYSARKKCLQTSPMFSSCEGP